LVAAGLANGDGHNFSTPGSPVASPPGHIRGTGQCKAPSRGSVGHMIQNVACAGRLTSCQVLSSAVAIRFNV
jgi:hypothetical protein